MTKTVFITGASRGIGLATAKKFISEGWKVVGFYNQKPGDIQAGCTWYQLDMSDSRSIKGVFEKALSEHGQIDAFVNCAGIFGYKNLIDYDEELMDKVINVNEKGTYLTTKAVLSNMKSGSIVYISSTAAQVGSTDPIYAATKAAIFGFTKSMAKALAPNIRVNCIAPGVTNSDMTKNMKPERLAQHKDMTLLKRIAEPEDIAETIYFLSSDASKHITGSCIDINGGYVLRQTIV